MKKDYTARDIEEQVSSGEDFYSVLGADSSDGQQEIQKAYREKVKEMHADKRQGAEQETSGKFSQAHEDMVRVNRAYSILKDPEKRAEYDNDLNAATLRSDERATRKASAEERTTQQEADHDDETTTQDKGNSEQSAQDESDPDDASPEQEEKEEPAAEEETPHQAGRHKRTAQNGGDFARRMKKQRRKTRYYKILREFDFSRNYGGQTHGFGNGFIYSDRSRDQAWVQRQLKAQAFCSAKGAVDPELVREFVDAGTKGSLIDYLLVNKKGDSITKLDQLPREYLDNMHKSVLSEAEKNEESSGGINRKAVKKIEDAIKAQELAAQKKENTAGNKNKYKASPGF